MKTVYSFCPKTGEYIGTTTTDPSPLEPGEYLFPARTTETPPPDAGENERAVWDGQAWHIVEDHRGKKGCLDGVEHEITELGPLPETWSETPPEPTEAEKRESEHQQIIAELNSLDFKAIRPLCAIGAGMGTEKDKEVLKDIEVRKVELREKLKGDGEINGQGISRR